MLAFNWYAIAYQLENKSKISVDKLRIECYTVFEVEVGGKRTSWETYPLVTPAPSLTQINKETQVMPQENDFTPSGLKVEGSWENDRNQKNSDLYKAIMREAFNVTDVIIGHHLLYVCEDKRDDGFSYQVVQEIPSADTLIFDHDVAKKIWGEEWKGNLGVLALEPVDTRDALLQELWERRCNAKSKTR